MLQYVDALFYPDGSPFVHIYWVVIEPTISLILWLDDTGCFTYHYMTIYDHDTDT